MPETTDYREVNRKIEERREERKRRLIRELFDFSEILIIAVIALLLLTSFFFRQAVVEGGSMEGTLKSGERLLISDFFYTPAKGDIVVVQTEPALADRYQLGQGGVIIKRVVAVSGDRIRIQNGTVYVNGAPIEEPYLYLDGADRIKTMEEITVSDGHVFLLGDHRNNSLDSRYFGEVDERSILGKALLRITPFSRFGSVNN